MSKTKPAKRYKKRLRTDAYNLHVKVDVQSFVDLRAIAEAACVTMGEVVDKLIQREVRKREKKLGPLIEVF